MVNIDGYEEFLSVQEFSKIVKIHPNTVRRSIKNGRLSAFRIGSGKRSDYRIARSEIGRISMIDLEKIVNKMVQERLSSLNIETTTAIKE